MENQKRICVAICFGSSNHFTGLLCHAMQYFRAPTHLTVCGSKSASTNKQLHGEASSSPPLTSSFHGAYIFTGNKVQH